MLRRVTPQPPVIRSSRCGAKIPLTWPGSILLTLTVLASACSAPPGDPGDRDAPALTNEDAPSATVGAPDGVVIAYEAYGDGAPALVFVHGWSCDRTYWSAQLEPFSRARRVVAVDLGGHGESGLGRDTWTINSFGADVAAVVEALGLDRIVPIGHSMGGDVIVEAARRLPGRVEGLVWIDTYSQLGTSRTPEQIEGMLAPFRDDFESTTVEIVRGMFPGDADPSLVGRVAADMAAAPPAVALQALESAWTYAGEVTAALDELALPLVAINPDNHATDVESLEQHGVHVVLMPGVGHFMMLEEPARFNAVLTGVLDELVR